MKYVVFYQDEMVEFEDRKDAEIFCMHLEQDCIPYKNILCGPELIKQIKKSRKR